MTLAQSVVPRAVRARRSMLGALLALSFGASAQTADPVAPFLGVWSGVFTTQDNEYWTLADIQCFVGCPLEFYNALSALLADPANDAVPAMALAGQSSAAWRAAFDATLTPMGRQVLDANKPEDDPKFLNCQPYGFVREVTNPLPMQISRDGDHLLVRYEEWSLLRPIYMDGRPHPTHRTPSRLGHSVGRVENGAQSRPHSSHLPASRKIKFGTYCRQLADEMSNRWMTQRSAPPRFCVRMVAQ